MSCCCYACAFQNECVYFTFFSISAALASLVSTLVWSTMLSVDTRRTEERESEKAKKEVGKIRVSDIAPFSLAHAVHPHTSTNRCIQSKHPIVSQSFSTSLKLKIREKIVTASHYNRMPSVARCFHTSLPFKLTLQDSLSDGVDVTERREHTYFTLCEIYLTPISIKLKKKRPYNSLEVIHCLRLCLAEDEVRRTQADQQGTFTE